MSIVTAWLSVKELLDWQQKNPEATAKFSFFFESLADWGQQCATLLTTADQHTSQSPPESTADMATHHQFATQDEALQQLFNINYQALLSQNQHEPALWFPRLLLTQVLTPDQIKQYLASQSEESQAVFNARHVFSKQIDASANVQPESVMGTRSNVGFFTPIPIDVMFGIYNKLSILELYNLRKTNNVTIYVVATVALFTRRGSDACRIQGQLMSHWLTNQKQRDWVFKRTKEYGLQLDFLGCMQDTTGDYSHKHYCLLMQAEINQAVNANIIMAVKNLLKKLVVSSEIQFYSVLAQWLIAKEPAYSHEVKASLVGSRHDSEFTDMAVIIRPQWIERGVSIQQRAYAALVRSVLRFSDVQVGDQNLIDFSNALGCIVSYLSPFMNACRLISEAFSPLTLANYLLQASDEVDRNNDNPRSMAPELITNYGWLAYAGGAIPMVPRQLISQLISFADRQSSSVQADNVYVVLCQIALRLEVIPDDLHERITKRAASSSEYRVKLQEHCGNGYYQLYSEKARRLLVQSNIGRCIEKTSREAFGQFEEQGEYRLLRDDCDYYGEEIFRSEFANDLHGLASMLCQKIGVLNRVSGFLATVNRFRIVDIFTVEQRQLIANAHVTALTDDNTKIPTILPNILEKSLLVLVTNEQLLKLCNGFLARGEFEWLCSLDLTPLSSEQAAALVGKLITMLSSNSEFMASMTTLLLAHSTLIQAMTAGQLTIIKNALPNDPKVKVNFIEILKRRYGLNDNGRAEIVDLIERMLGDQNPRVRLDALEVLIEVAPDNPWLFATLLPVFLKEIDSANPKFSVISLFLVRILLMPENLQSKDTYFNLLAGLFVRMTEMGCSYEEIGEIFRGVMASELLGYMQKQAGDLLIKNIRDRIEHNNGANILDFIYVPVTNHFYKFSLENQRELLAIFLTACLQTNTDQKDEYIYFFLEPIALQLSDEGMIKLLVTSLFPIINNSHETASVKVSAVAVLANLSQVLLSKQLCELLKVLVHHYDQHIEAIDNKKLAIQLFTRLTVADQAQSIELLCAQMRNIGNDGMQEVLQLLLIDFFSYYHAKKSSTQAANVLAPAVWGDLPGLLSTHHAILALFETTFSALAPQLGVENGDKLAADSPAEPVPANAEVSPGVQFQSRG